MSYPGVVKASANWW